MVSQKAPQRTSDPEGKISTCSCTTQGAPKTAK